MLLSPSADWSRIPSSTGLQRSSENRQGSQPAQTRKSFFLSFQGREGKSQTPPPKRATFFRNSRTTRHQVSTVVIEHEGEAKGEKAQEIHVKDLLLLLTTPTARLLSTLSFTSVIIIIWTEISITFINSLTTTCSLSPYSQSRTQTRDTNVWSLTLIFSLYESKGSNYFADLLLHSFSIWFLGRYIASFCLASRSHLALSQSPWVSQPALRLSLIQPLQPSTVLLAQFD